MKQNLQKLIKEVLSNYNVIKLKCNCGCNTCKNVGNPGPVLNENLDNKFKISKNLQYHINNKLPLTENTFRYGSESFLNLWLEARHLYSRNIIHLNDIDKEIINETNLGEYGMYEGKMVPLDLPMVEEVQILDGYEVDFFKTKANIYANIEIPSENPTFEDDIQIKGTGQTEEEAFEDLKQNYEKYKKGLYEVDKKKTPPIGKPKGKMVPLDLPMVEENTDEVVAILNNPNIEDDVKSMLFNAYKSGKLSSEQVIDIIKKTVKEHLNEAEYQGKEVQLGKPKRDSSGGKAYKVYVRDPKTKKVKIVRFGSGGLKAKINNPKARRAFAARQRCGKGELKTSAKWWSCRLPKFAKLLGLKGSYSGFW